MDTLNSFEAAEELLRQSDWEALCRALLDKPPLIQLRDKWGASLLHRTVHSPYAIRFVEALLDAGADPNLVDATGVTPLGAAIASSQSHDPRLSNINIIESLVISGARLDTCAQIGEPPLHVAALTGRADVIDCLLRHGVDITIANEYGETALQVALDLGHDMCARLLASAESERKNGYGTKLQQSS
jgi:ankyrin repeat protein